MIKYFFSILIFLFIFLFIFFVTSTYLSNTHQQKINSNRANINTNLKIEENLPNLSLLKNDTNNVIEFNSGYEGDSTKIKRNFWDLFKKND